LYIVKIGELDTDNGKLLIVAADSKKCERIIETGLTPTDLVFDEKTIYISNFDSNTITAIDKTTYKVKSIKTGNQPFKMSLYDNVLFVINHKDNTLQEIGETSSIHNINFEGRPDNIFAAGKKLILTTHSSNALRILAFDPETREFGVLIEKSYPFGETTFDTNNSSFYTRGQFGDCIFEITKIKQDKEGRLWIIDFLSGKLFIIN